MNNAAHLEQWPESVHSQVCLILSSLAHTSAFILRHLTKQVPRMHTRVLQAVTGI